MKLGRSIQQIHCTARYTLGQCRPGLLETDDQISRKNKYVSKLGAHRNRAISIHTFGLIEDSSG